MHERPSVTARTARTVCMLAIIFVAAQCGDDVATTQTPPPLVDARLIAFTSDSDNSMGSSVSDHRASAIFIMHADGSHKTRLTSQHFADSYPTWSPDGSSITFETDRPPSGIWIMNADGSNPRPLLSYPAVNLPSELHWSPNGHLIAFMAFVEGVSVIMIADADGSHMHRLTSSTRSELWPSWSPDGSRIAYMGRSDSVGYSIFVVKPDGTDQQQLSYGADFQPEWSPDGTRIAFTNLQDSYHPQIFVMRADGSQRHALTVGGAYSDPSWSPDSRRLMYDGYDADSTSANALRIFRINADGTDARALTSDGSDYYSFSESWSPAWKPAP